MAEFNSLARWIVEKGIRNIKPEMLSDDVRYKVFTEVGLMLFRANKVADAVLALTYAGNCEKLLEMGDEYYRQAQFLLAALAYIPTKNKERLEKVAPLCANEGNYSLAYHAFKAAGNEGMASFLKENFEVDA